MVSGLPCVWRFYQEDWCDSACGFYSPNCGAAYYLYVQCAIDPTTCQMEVLITLSVNAGHEDCDADCPYGSALYRTSSPPASCTGVFTLTKISEDWSGPTAYGTPGSAVCLGALPSTITVAA